jgi:transposase-like protein
MDEGLQYGNSLAIKLFVEEVLKYCDGRPTFVVNGAPWLREVLEEIADMTRRISTSVK